MFLLFLIVGVWRAERRHSGVSAGGEVAGHDAEQSVRQHQSNAAAWRDVHAHCIQAAQRQDHLHQAVHLLRRPQLQHQGCQRKTILLQIWP